MAGWDGGGVEKSYFDENPIVELDLDLGFVKFKLKIQIKVNNLLCDKMIEPLNHLLQTNRHTNKITSLQSTHSLGAIVFSTIWLFVNVMKALC